MQKVILLIGAVLAGLSVALGAFGAHGLKKMVDPETVANYQTGVQYQMYHALALLILGVLLGRAASSLAHYAGFFFIGGVVFFSGSLYLMASLKAMDKVVPKAVFIMTPIGGLLFIVGWILFLIYLLRN